MLTESQPRSRAHTKEDGFFYIAKDNWSQLQGLEFCVIFFVTTFGDHAQITSCPVKAGTLKPNTAELLRSRIGSYSSSSGGSRRTGPPGRVQGNIQARHLLTWMRGGVF